MFLHDRFFTGIMLSTKSCIASFIIKEVLTNSLLNDECVLKILKWNSALKCPEKITVL